MSELPLRTRLPLGLSPLQLPASWTPTSWPPPLSTPASFESQVLVEVRWPSRGSLGRRLLGRGSLRGLVSASWDLGLRPSGKGGDRLDRLQVKKKDKNLVLSFSFMCRRSRRSPAKRSALKSTNLCEPCFSNVVRRGRFCAFLEFCFYTQFLHWYFWNGSDVKSWLILVSCVFQSENLGPTRYRVEI